LKPVLHNNLQAIIDDVADFDRGSGSFLERVIFNNRAIILGAFAVLTIFFGTEATKLKLNANFEGTIPTTHPFMVNYMSHASRLSSNANALQIVVENNNGNLANPQYLATLERITTAVLDLPGVNRPFTTSLWTPTTRWTSVDETGIIGGLVIDDTYDGSPADVATVKQNILRTGRVGELVGTDFQSSVIFAPLMDHNGLTGKPIDYDRLAQDLANLRAEYSTQGVTLHIVGYAMIVGDVLLGIRKILSFFAITAVIATGMLFWFTRSARSTFLVVTCTLIAVIWQLGLLPLMGYDLDPYSVLVPFLIFAIGMSHGAQKMNGVMQDIGRGTHQFIAARYTFRRLFVAGFTALICDAVGFAVLLLIKIEEIRELALIASAGVMILILTNLILLPVFLSYVGVDKKAAARSLNADTHDSKDAKLWRFLARFTQRKWAAPTVVVAIVLSITSYSIGRHAQIGNVGVGAPELRQTSQYNRDARYIQDHYVVSGDSLVVFADSPPSACTSFQELSVLDRLVVTYITELMTDASPKWAEIIPNQSLINALSNNIPVQYASLDCSFVPLTVSLNDLKASSLRNVVGVIQKFIADPENQGPGFSLSLAGGNGGIAAATNDVIHQANTHMLLWIYSAVALLCFITFRSLPAVACAVLPLLLTSLLCQALMVLLGIGITVSTLPVVALGVGIGIDYALYVLGVTMVHLRAGVPLEEAYQNALKFTGRVVMFTGFTLAVGVGVWVLAPIKFQADMGLLLAFMFLWNMFGALIVLPALASFLLRPTKIIRNGVAVSEYKFPKYDDPVMSDQEI
jgi:predicted RND superfamily exporter protein